MIASPSAHGCAGGRFQGKASIPKVARGPRQSAGLNLTDVSASTGIHSSETDKSPPKVVAFLASRMPSIGSFTSKRLNPDSAQSRSSRDGIPGAPAGLPRSTHKGSASKLRPLGLRLRGDRVRWAHTDGAIRAGIGPLQGWSLRCHTIFPSHSNMPGTSPAPS